MTSRTSKQSSLLITVYRMGFLSVTTASYLSLQRGVQENKPRVQSLCHQLTACCFFGSGVSAECVASLYFFPNVSLGKGADPG